jgi:predicted acyltransferase
VHLRILRRAVVLMACGLLLNLLGMLPGPFDFGRFRFPGVLQRYGLVYPLAAELYLFMPRRFLPWVTAGILIGYWALTAHVPVPGFGPPDLWRFPAGEVTPNLAAWLDHRLLGRHVYEYPFDPEGLLGTFPTLATALIGISAGEAWRQPQPRVEGIFAKGAALLAAGYLWGQFHPLCKKVWSGSFVLLTAGFGLIVLAALPTADRRWLALPRWYGRNPLLAIVGFTALDALTASIPVGHGAYLKDLLFARGFASWLPLQHASWVYSVVGILLVAGALRALDRRGLYLKA